MASSTLTYRLKAVTREFTGGMNRASDSAGDLTRDLRKLERGTLEQREANVKVARAQKQVNRLMDSGRRDTLQYQAAQVRLERAQEKAARTGHRHTTALRGMGRAAKYAAGALAAGGAYGLVTVLKDSAEAASDVNESITKNRVLFGRYAKDVRRFSDNSAVAFGISKRAALEYTGVFGNLFRSLGTAQDESAGMSVQLTKLAADMASFNNASIEDALEAIRSGLVGETEPLRRFGVTMQDATLRVQAMKMGLTDTTKNTLTPYQRAMAAVALITKQTSNAHGDFKRTSEGAANQQRIFKAQIDDLKVSLGDNLLPVMNKGLIAANKFIAGFREGTGAGGRFRDTMERLVEQIRPVAVQTGRVVAAIAKFVAKNPEIAKVAAGFVAVAGAIKAIKFASKITGLATFLRAATTGANTFKTIWATAGSVAGRRASANTAAALTQQLPKSIAARQSRMATAMTALGTYLGPFLGAAMAAFALRELGKKLFEALGLDPNKGDAETSTTAGDAFNRLKKLFGGKLSDLQDVIQGKASGGWVGRRGDVGVDAIPALLGRGEAVLNRHQQRPVEAALRRTYGIGLDDLFSKVRKPHYSPGNPFDQMGGPADNVRGGATRGSSKSSVWGSVESIARRFGVSSTGPGQRYRPGDTDSYHGVGMARDYSNGWATKEELAFAKAVWRAFGGQILELIHTPLGWSVKNGRKVPPYSRDDHYDHVHVALPGGATPGDMAFAGITVEDVKAVAEAGMDWLGSLSFDAARSAIAHYAQRALNYATGGRAQGGPFVRGRVSWFGGPRDPSDSGRTALGLTTATPGVAIRPGASYESGRPFLGGYWKITAPNGRRATLRQTDLGPHQSTGRRIDLTYSALGRFGFTERNFPTDSVWRAYYVGETPGGGGGAPKPKPKPKKPSVRITDRAHPANPLNVGGAHSRAVAIRTGQDPTIRRTEIEDFYTSAFEAAQLTQMPEDDANVIRAALQYYGARPWIPFDQYPSWLQDWGRAMGYAPSTEPTEPGPPAWNEGGDIPLTGEGFGMAGSLGWSDTAQRFPNVEAWLNAMWEQAQLTQSTADDEAVRAQAQQYWGARPWASQFAPDWLNAQSNTQQAIADTLKSIDDQLKEQAAYRDRVAGAQGAYKALATAIATVASAEIGGIVGLGSQTPTFSGGYARY